MLRYVFLTLVLVLPVAAMPDLVIDSPLRFSFSSGSSDTRAWRSGQVVMVSGRLSNIGTTTAIAPAVDLTVNGVTIGSRLFVGVRPGRSSEFAIRWMPTTRGPHDVRVTADPSNRIAEISETNNVTSATIRLGADSPIVAPPPDTFIVADGHANLVVGPLSLSKNPRVKRGGSILRFEVSNRGTFRARNVEVSFRANGESEVIRNVGTLQPGQSRTISINWVPRATGTTVLDVMIDPAFHVSESNETDNRSTMSVTVR